MTSEKKLRHVAAQLLRNALRSGKMVLDYRDLDPNPEFDYDEKKLVSDLLSTWPVPDMPPSDNSFPCWIRGSIHIEPGGDAGDVTLEWSDRRLNLTSDQVEAIIAAHYHRKDHK